MSKIENSIIYASTRLLQIHLKQMRHRTVSHFPLVGCIMWYVLHADACRLCKGVSTLCHTAKCNKIQPCSAANGENNVNVNAVWLRQGFCMPCGMKIRSAKCQFHQRFAVWHMMSKGFQNGISQLEKKIRRSSLVSVHSFCNLKYNLQKILF